MTTRKYRAAKLAPKIIRFLKPILRHGRFRLRFQVVDANNPHPDFENPDVVVKFTGPDVPLLLSNKAELLLALEHLTMEVLKIPPEDHARLCFDANDYRALRIEELRMSAAAAAERVRLTGTPFEFSPMTSRERRIIHLALRNEPDVYTESAGTGAQRHVVVYPKETPKPAKTPPLPPGPQYSIPKRRR